MHVKICGARKIYLIVNILYEGESVKEVKISVPELEDILPEEFVDHILNATKEILLALRTLIDLGIDKIEAVEEIAKAKKEIKKTEIE